MERLARINVDEPLYDCSTFAGRFRHFAWMTDPRTVMVPKARLMEAKTLLEEYQLDLEPCETRTEQIHYAMKLYWSAFHPDTGDLQNVIGRMSFQVPGGMLITGGMLAFYRSTFGVVLWQFINQSFNAVVNYTNRNANSPLTTMQLGAAYVSATTSALIVALGCKRSWQRKASPLLQRYVPFAAVAAANCVNIPLMRQNEIVKGVQVKDSNGNAIGKSQLAAVIGISQVICSRIVMAAPGMLVLPIIMEKIERAPFYQRNRWMNLPLQTSMAGAFLLFMVPAACALFPQTCKMRITPVELLEPSAYREMEANTGGNIPKEVYFNKGL